MRKYLLIILLISACTITISCKNNSKPTKEISISIDTLYPEGKMMIERDLMTEQGVVFVKAHLRKKIITIVYDTTANTKEQLMRKIETLGFKCEASPTH